MGGIIHLLIVCGCFCVTASELRSGNTKLMAHKAQNIKYFAFSDLTYIFLMNSFQRAGATLNSWEGWGLMREGIII